MNETTNHLWEVITVNAFKILAYIIQLTHLREPDNLHNSNTESRNSFRILEQNLCFQILHTAGHQPFPNCLMIMSTASPGVALSNDYL